MQMHASLVITLIALLLGLPTSVRAQPTEHEAAAQRYISAMSIRRLLTPLVADYVSTVPAQGRLQVANEIFRSLEVDQVKKAVTAALIQTYTVQELDAMTAFFGSPLGKSILDKSIDLESYLNLALREEILASITRALQRLGR
jgi:uncharacterized protein